MSLKKTIDDEIKNAMRAKDKDRLTALRSIKSLILLAETEKAGSHELDEAAEMAILTKAAKQRRDSLAVYKEQGRQDLADKEEQELKVIEEFLPKQMSEDEIKSALKEIIAESGAEGMKDMGKVMGMATKKLAGKADNKIISSLVKELLS